MSSASSPPTMSRSHVMSGRAGARSLGRTGAPFRWLSRLLLRSSIVLDISCPSVQMQVEPARLKCTLQRIRLGLTSPPAANSNSVHQTTRQHGNEPAKNGKEKSKKEFGFSICSQSPESYRAANLVTNPSVLFSRFRRLNAFGVVGKLLDLVSPAMYTLPGVSTAIAQPLSVLNPPR